MSLEHFNDAALSIVFRMAAYIAFGLTMELCFTVVSSLVDGKITDEDKRLRGVVSLYMIPVYGILLLAMFEPAFWLLSWLSVPWYGRILVYAVCITATEALCGYLYDKLFKVKPWDYSQCPDRIFPNGYARWAYFPLWGLAGLVLEHYVTFVVKISAYVPEVIRGLGAQ